MTQFPGNEDFYPEDFTIADDSAAPTAGPFNVGLEANGDRTAYLRAKAATAFVNFGQKVAPGLGVAAAAFDPVARIWIVVGGTNGGTANIRRSSSHGWTWDGATLATGGSGENNATNLDIAPDGSVVVACASRYVFQSAGGASSGTFAGVDVLGSPAYLGAGGTGLQSSSRIVYDPVHSKWIFVAIGTVAAAEGPLEIWTSPDRTTWTSRTPSAGMAVSFRLWRIACKKSTGRTVFLGYVPGATPKIVKPVTSDDGGVTWTDRATFQPAVTSPTEASLSYNALTDTWLYTIGKTSSPASEVWRSTDDGVTWTKIATLSATCLMCPAAFGDVWVDNASRTLLGAAGSEIVYSLDSGVTWKIAGFATTSAEAAMGVFAALSSTGKPAQLLAIAGDLDSGNVWPSDALGRPNFGSAT